jgi:hypothetical protein
MIEVQLEGCIYKLNLGYTEVKRNFSSPQVNQSKRKLSHPVAFV